MRKATSVWVQITTALTAIALMSCGGLAASAPTPTELQAQNLRAVSLLSGDPLWEGRPETRFKLRQFRDIRRAGFNAVRINLVAFRFMDASNTLEPGWFAKLDRVVNTAQQAGLTVILDQHDNIECRAAPQTCKAKLIAFWSQVAPHFSTASNRVIFEVMNEPGGPVSPAVWNQWQQDALAVIRQTNPTRNVIVGPACSNARTCLDRLQLPRADRRLIVTFHYYEPLEFTHQGAPWDANRALSGVRWGSPAEVAKIRADFEGVKQWSIQNRRPIVLGEFGAYEEADMTTRARYIAAVARTAESYGFGWSFWQFQTNFSVFDIDRQTWKLPLLNALFPKSAPR